MAKSQKSMEPKKDYLANVAFGRSDHIPRIIEIAMNNLEADPSQPRKSFDEIALSELATSIKEKGLIQPITVRHNPDREGAFIIVAGERRYRACHIAGLLSVGCIVTKGDPAEIALIENIQRVDLNPIEEAEAISKLMQAHNYTQETVAKTLGKSRVSVTETLSLLKLPAELLEKCRTSDMKKAALAEIVRMDAAGQKEAIAHIEETGTLTRLDALAIKRGEGRGMTPVKLATKAMYASIERLSQIDGKPKTDEMKMLREAKRKLDETFKTSIG
jgi:ParB family transcriptional regulator, chromosome partitioning protein